MATTTTSIIFMYTSKPPFFWSPTSSSDVFNFPRDITVLGIRANYTPMPNIKST